MQNLMLEPRPTRLRVIYGAALAVALLGLADAIYLTAEHLAGRTVKCTVTGGCSKVLSSGYASLLGIPTAAFGALGYFTVFSLATLAVFGYRWAASALAPVVAAMLAVTVWLFFVQAFVLKAFCQFCLLSAACTLALAALVVLARRINGRSAVR